MHNKEIECNSSINENLIENNEMISKFESSNQHNLSISIIPNNFIKSNSQQIECNIDAIICMDKNEEENNDSIVISMMKNNEMNTISLEDNVHEEDNSNDKTINNLNENKSIKSSKPQYKTISFIKDILLSILKCILYYVDIGLDIWVMITYIKNKDYLYFAFTLNIILGSRLIIIPICNKIYNPNNSYLKCNSKLILRMLSTSVFQLENIIL